jgi:hydroxyacid-oxoacid transhydrogenase
MNRDQPAGIRPVPTDPESVFAWAAPPVVFGRGALDETGAHVAALGARSVALITDLGLVASGLAERAATSLRAAGLEVACFDRVHVEPTDGSLREAAVWARERRVDAFVALGGGSTIDTAKVMNLLSTNDGELEDYLNPPVGRGLAPTRPLTPLIAIPTTAGTGAESTPVCVVDVRRLHLKVGISHGWLRPRLAIVDPITTLTLPADVTAASGMDVLCHALESWTAIPFNAKARYAEPAKRPAYNGSNPISDVWCAEALRLLGRWFRAVVERPDDLDAREGMMAAAMYAGIGFGNAGVHLPHACAYPIAGLVRSYRPEGYPGDEPLVPHGQSVVATAPAVFRFTYPASPTRHEEAARLLAGDRALATGRDALSEAVVDLCRDVGIPNGIAAFGFGEADIPALVEGALKQQRLLQISPRETTAEDLAAIFGNSISNW